MFGKSAKSNSLKIAAAVLLAVALCFCAFALSACDPQSAGGSKTVYVYIGDSAAIEYETQAENMFDVLTEMKNAGKISGFTYSGTENDAFVTSIGDIAPDSSANEYAAFFHTVDDVAYRDMSDWAAADRTVDGKVFHYSGVGVKLMPACDGASYLFVVLTF